MKFLIQDFVQKPKFYIYSKPQVLSLVSAMKVWSHIFGQPRFNPFLRASLVCFNLLCSSPKSILGNSTTPSFGSFHSVEPPSATSETLHRLDFLPDKTSPNCLGSSRNPSAERPERQVHSCIMSHHVYNKACFASPSTWNRLSPLVSFRGSPLPTF